MDPTTRAMLNDSEQALLRETKKRRLHALDEDALIDLHTRIRRARRKYVKLHRRRGAAQVRKDRSRTRATGAVTKTAVKAEAFEEALGVVSARLAEVAAEAAEALKQERLAAARKAKARTRGTAKGGGKKGKGGARSRTARPDSKATGRARGKRPVEKRKVASERAAKARKQAKR